MKIVTVKGIEWDTDGVPQTELGLPNEVQLPVSDKQYEEMLDDPDAIADELSDTYGYCVKSYESDSLE